MTNETPNASASETAGAPDERKAWETPAMQMLNASSTELNPIITNDGEGTAS